MGLIFLTANSPNCCWCANTKHFSTRNPHKSRRNSNFTKNLEVRASARRNSVKKLKRNKEGSENSALQTTRNPSDESNVLELELAVADGFSQKDEFVKDEKKMDNLTDIPSRSAVIQACTVTSALTAALGLIIRQGSHIASIEGLPILDCSTEVTYGFEIWHLELITGLVILISSCRYLLLKTWPDFAKSSEAANQQVLTSLQPLDYMVVAFLPGVSEELLFRGALIPVFGNNLASVSVVAAIFGALHLGNGRKYSFAAWAAFVGFAYGYATIFSSSIIVPMVSHAVNNLVGGILWRYTKNSTE